ncbi:hypothetical protein FVE85_3143 [Porphyridium purpureum]|uniref:Uncharacterized protein n=1 Tax=Porphyridium purpureum TaxID=35688 RepID=A0A5J4YVM1_PORPP|nr:hypothetical protein FVE85_3143 [Porphyridium purpureum]|eukprot:POR5258..scf227_4
MARLRIARSLALDKPLQFSVRRTNLFRRRSVKPLRCTNVREFRAQSHALLTFWMLPRDVHNARSMIRTNAVRRFSKRFTGITSNAKSIQSRVIHHASPCSGATRQNITESAFGYLTSASSYFHSLCCGPTSEPASQRASHIGVERSVLDPPAHCVAYLIWVCVTIRVCLFRDAKRHWPRQQVGRTHATVEIGGVVM